MIENENKENMKPENGQNTPETAQGRGAARRRPARRNTAKSENEKSAAPRKPASPRKPRAAAPAQEEKQAAPAQDKPRAPRRKSAPQKAEEGQAAGKPQQASQDTAQSAAPSRGRVRRRNPQQPRGQQTRAQAAPQEAANAAQPRRKPAAERPRQGRRHIVAPVVQEEKPCISQTLQLTGKRPPSMRSRASEHPTKSTLRMIPLGGMCEIGKNMTAYEYGNDIIIVDCGQIFPDETMPGVDAVIPDFTYVLQNRDRVRGIFITHGHEDHIGGLPYLLREFKAPVYGGRMTIELLRYKLDDRVARPFQGLLAQRGGGRSGHPLGLLQRGVHSRQSLHRRCIHVCHPHADWHHHALGRFQDRLHADQWRDHGSAAHRADRPRGRAALRVRVDQH